MDLRGDCPFELADARGIPGPTKEELSLGSFNDAVFMPSLDDFGSRSGLARTGGIRAGRTLWRVGQTDLIERKFTVVPEI